MNRDESIIQQADVKREAYMKEAYRLISEALEMMTIEQVSSWRGVRAWIECYNNDDEVTRFKSE